MSYTTEKITDTLDKIEMGGNSTLFIDLPNGDSVAIFAYQTGNVSVTVARHNGDYTDYPNSVDYNEKVKMSNVERRTSNCKTDDGEKFKVNQKSLTLTGLNKNRTLVVAETFNTESNYRRS